MAKLLTLFLGVFLLVIIIYGVQNKGFGPLVENIKGRYNEVLILLNIRDDGVPKCGDAFPESIDGMSGMFYPCEDSCLFVLDGEESLLGFTNFSIKEDKIALSGKGVSDSDEAYRFGVGESERHKMAYNALNDTVGEFLVSEGIGEEEFVEMMSFDKDGVVFWEIDDAMDNTAYGYVDGVWRKGQVEDEKFVPKTRWFASKDSNIMTNEEVFSSVLKMYNTFKRYNNDRDVYLRYSNFIGDNEESFGNWFLYAKDRLIDSEDEKLSIIFGRKGNSDVSYLWDGEKWEGVEWEGAEYKRGALDKRVIASTKSLGFFNDDEVISVIFEKYSNGENFNFRKSLYSEKLWSVKEGEVRYTYNPVDDKNDEEFRKLFFDSLAEWGSKKKSQGDLLKKMGDYFKGGVTVDFNGQSFPVEFTELSFEDGHRFPLISFNVSNSEKFSIYYESGVPVLITSNMERSGINKFLDSEDWGEFIEINKIYEHFKLKRCGHGQ